MHSHPVIVIFQRYRQKNFQTCSEFRWIDTKSGKDEFADIVLAHQRMVALRSVVEAKRARNGAWIFLHAPKAVSTTRRLRYFWAHREAELRFGWHDGETAEGSFVTSSFCVIRGQSHDRPLLERLASCVLLATESVGKREIYIGSDTFLMYIPVIVTTARLVIHAFDPGAVDPITGDLEESAYIEVPYILFKKSIGTVYSTSKRSRDLSGLNREDERNVLVVNSLYVVDALTILTTLQPQTGYEKPPWA